jgi:ISXO2-like transposase domain
VERGGRARTFHIEQADQATVHSIMKANIKQETRVHTDESAIYNIAPWHFEKHETVKHTADEYVRGDVTTNSVEGYFSVFKRGMKGLTNIVRKSTFTAILPSLISGITVARLSASAMWPARNVR